MERAMAVRPPLRVVLVDDHQVVRDGLRGALSQASGLEVVGEGATVEAAVAVIRAQRPDVVVLDVRLPGGGGPAVLRALADDERPAVLAVSASDERDDVVATVRAGADGYLLKSAPTERIVAAIRRVADGEPVFSPELAGHLLDLDAADAVDDPNWRALTDREREVLRLLARGHPYKRIAEDLHVSPKTVETHVRNLLRKLQLTTRHEASRWAMEHGLG